MALSTQIEAVYRRALALRQLAIASPVQQNLLEQALAELHSVLEELQASEEEVWQQHQELISTRNSVEVERQRYFDLFDQAPDGYLVTDARGRIQEANLAIATKLNISQQFLIGKPLLVFIAEADYSAFYAGLDRLQQTQSIQNWELRLWPRQGVAFDAGITINSIRQRGSDRLQFRWLLRDISEIKQIKLLLEQLNADLNRQVKERTRQLQQADHLESGLKRITDKVRDHLDENYILQAVVQELVVTLGALCCETASYDLALTTSTVRYQATASGDDSSGSASPSAPSQTSAPGQTIQMAAFAAGYRQLLQNQYFQYCDIAPGSVHGYATILACPIADERGVLGDIFLFKPSTEVFNEAAIRFVQQVANQCAIAIRQARLYQSAQRQVAELERLNRLKDDFLDTVSHELRTPMSSIRMAIQLLGISLNSIEAAPPEVIKANRYLQILEYECKREMNLIDQLLDLTRLEAQTEPLALATIEPSLWIPRILEPFASLISLQQQQLKVDIPPDLPSLETDCMYLQRILTELMNNAYKYTDAEEAIAVSAVATLDGLRLSISNSGIEIPAEELDRIFDKFYRIPSNDPWKHGGTGLGLALVKKRVAQIGSTIEVISANNWVTFTLTIPWHLGLPAKAA